jgi:hypothetical protein
VVVVLGMSVLGIVPHRRRCPVISWSSPSFRGHPHRFVVVPIVVVCIVPHCRGRPRRFVVVPIVVVCIVPHRRRRPRHFVVVPVISWSSPSFRGRPHRRGLPIFVLSLSSLSRCHFITPVSIPRAVAHGGGGRRLCGASNTVVVRWKHPRSTLRAEARRAGADAWSSVVICVVLDAVARRY